MSTDIQCGPGIIAFLREQESREPNFPPLMTKKEFEELMSRPVEPPVLYVGREFLKIYDRFWRKHSYLYKPKKHRGKRKKKTALKELKYYGQNKIR